MEVDIRKGQGRSISTFLSKEGRRGCRCFYYSSKDDNGVCDFMLSRYYQGSNERGASEGRRGEKEAR